LHLTKSNRVHMSGEQIHISHPNTLIDTISIHSLNI